MLFCRRKRHGGKRRAAEPVEARVRPTHSLPSRSISTFQPRRSSSPCLVVKLIPGASPSPGVLATGPHDRTGAGLYRLLPK